MFKKIEKFLVGILVLVMALYVPVSVWGASPTLSSSKYMKCYPVGGSISVFTDSSLKIRGTASPYKKYNASIYSADEVYVFSWNNSWAYISYPVGRTTRRYGYIRTTDITPNNYSVDNLKSITRFNTYQKPTGSAIAGYIDNGDRIWINGYQSGRYQAIYPSGNNYRMAWISSYAYNNYLKSNNTQSLPTFSTRPLADGYYAFVSGNSSSRVLDIHNFEFQDGANLELYQKNITANQVFYVKYVGNGYYMIAALHSGKVLDVANGNRSSGTNVWTYTWNSTDAQLWRFADAGNGYYYIQNKLGCFLDNSNGSTNLANNIIVYSFNGSAAQCWKPERCRLPDGATKYVKTSAGLKLRSAASTSASVLVTMPYRSTVKEYFCINGWSYVEYGGKKGYASSDYLSSEKPISPNNSPSGGYIINGVDIGYAAGSYFTDNGKACTDHGTKGIHSYYNESACNCICTYKGQSLGAVQCYGFARYVQSKLYGVNSYNSPNSFYKMSGASVAAGSLTASKLKSLITSAKVGAHIRTRGNAHSMIITNITSNGFSIIQCNGSNNNEYSGYYGCRIGTYTYTWNSYVNSTYGKRGIEFIELKK